MRFFTQQGANASLHLENLTLTGGSSANGGAVYSEGAALTLINTRFINNHTTGAGGAVVVFGAPIFVDGSTFESNSAGTGGALVLRYSLTDHVIKNSTFSGNTATQLVGAIVYYAIQGESLNMTNATIAHNNARGIAAIVAQGAVNFTNVTIANNTAQIQSYAVSIEESVNSQGTPNLPKSKLTNTLIAGNTADTMQRDIVLLDENQLDPASRNNLIQSAVANNTSAPNAVLVNGLNGNKIGVNAGLGTFGQNGGPTKTFSILAGSAARDAGTTIGAPADDQRGIARPQGSAPDIGAFERLAAEPSLLSQFFEFETRQALRFNFSADARELFQTASFTLTNVGTGGVFNTGTFEPNGTGTQISFIPSSILPDGNYRLVSQLSSVERTLNFHVFAGDANRDRTVNINDFSILASRFNLPGVFSQGDFNYDGVTNINDFAILASKFNTSLPANTGLPRVALFTGRSSPLQTAQNRSYGSVFDEVVADFMP